jgi:transcriptional regulator with XRE-family HTH domain
MPAGDRSGDPRDDDLVAALYLREGLSTRQIAVRVGLERQAVTRRLRRAGAPIVPRGAGRARRAQRVDEPEGFAARLRELYHDRRLTRRQVAERLGVTESLVRTRLAFYGITRRSRGGVYREDRRELPAADLVELYLRRGLSAQQVGRKLGVSRNLVLRQAHERGLPVRLGGPPTRKGPSDIELVEALYADSVVDRTLTRHGLPRVPPGAPIWRRFPTPVPLSAQLVRDLYVDCGLAAGHVELLTGQPAATVLGHLWRAGVPLRPRGGRCPFRRRWRFSQ